MAYILVQIINVKRRFRFQLLHFVDHLNNLVELTKNRNFHLFIYLFIYLFIDLLLQHLTSYLSLNLHHYLSANNILLLAFEKHLSLFSYHDDFVQ